MKNKQNNIDINNSNQSLNKLKTKNFSFEKCSVIITALIDFFAMSLSIYYIYFSFFDNYILPTNWIFDKWIIIIFIFLYGAMSISKCIFLFKVNIDTFCESLKSIALFFITIGFITKTLYLIAISSLISSGISVYITLNENNNIAVFFINSLLTVFSSALSLIFFIIGIIN